MEIFKIILLLYTVQYILAFILKTPFTTLNCGLWCFVGKEIPNEWKLKILGLYNQMRGEDSTGVCVDGLITKDVVTARKFFFDRPDVLNFSTYDMKNHAVLGHCRKASMQYTRTNVQYAHPHSTKVEGKDFLRLIHNGSISNCYDLASKYECDFSEKTDTMLLAEILTKMWPSQNMDVLKEYDGSATVIFYPMGRVDTLYVHRDKERELFYWRENKTACYISSMKGGLIAIGATEKDIVEFIPGILYKFFGAKITQTWDLKDKKPYTRPIQPRAKTNAIVRSNSRTTIKTVWNVDNTDGFYWENHRILYNGHAYIGEMFIENETAKVTKIIVKADRQKYALYYVIMGVLMKDKKSYEEVYKKCSDKNAFSPAKFKAILLSDLQPFILYPLLGKTYSDSDNKFFWSEEINKLKEISDLYRWSPPLSNQIFAIDRSGLLKETIENKPVRNVAEAIETCIISKTDGGQVYHAALDLLNDVKKVIDKKVDFNQFLVTLVTMLAQKSAVPKTSINRLETLADNEKYDWIENPNPYAYVHAVSEVLKAYMETIIEVNSTSNTLSNNYSEEAETFLSEQLVDDAHTNDAETYYKEQTWKDEVVFGNYNDLEEVITTFLQTDEASYVRPLFIGLAKLFKELGLISEDDVKKIASRDDVVTTKHELARYFSRLKDEKCLKVISDVFKDGRTNESFASIYDQYTGLHEKHGLSENDRLKLAILKMGLKYIQRKATTLDKALLAESYNISEKELQAI